MHEIDTLEELAIWAKGFIYLDRVNVEVELFVSASQKANAEPRCEGKNEKKGCLKLLLLPQSERT